MKVALVDLSRRGGEKGRKPEIVAWDAITAAGCAPQRPPCIIAAPPRTTFRTLNFEGEIAALGEALRRRTSPNARRGGMVKRY